ncbi:hypothetical protein [Pseudomonas syringae]|uniref:Uncharacterized protein n=4 Tax=Pseudomonas syringae TaxID=317 RepID=A0A656JIA4_PSESF|nr:hypothetical protein [Pseudomonas syringae]EPN26427.1 hypothetical protein A245_48290 [Pseudomonas syringae pv. actinidiae ICMP 19096]EPM43351.1 hypothetical protein A246_27439 [Pseudomonas syringae pv. actinidiae ICMP 19098]EPM68468.1 hypothetical protein A249_39665 [Pseudomonas syringae pv. actinidiae ICMP 18804]EPN14032.1 hypothetical protein A248_28216 [Pseudomonas syringae pv. actinidiae ICMP 19100]EPN22611.1 hypothetical protein A247_27851 [Pseudomonas syringae pv. actinidiae ICMP 190
MDDALVVFSRKGLFQTPITAYEIKSREHYRKMWPLVTTDIPHRLVSWVSPCFNDDGKLKTRSYFRTYSGKRGVRTADYFDGQEQSRQRHTGESEEHRRAKQLIADELQRRLDAGLAMPWYYRDETISEYHLAGNLLLGANAVTQEQNIKTPFGNSYRLDVAVLGKPILRHPMVLAGIEIELGHAFDGRKALAGRSMGFPLISIDITDMSLDQLTPQWARQALTATKSSDDEGRRKTFIYLNDLLYPLYVQLPSTLIEGDDFRHQFIVFAADEHLERVKATLAKVSLALGLQSPTVLLGIVNGKSASAAKQVANLGDIAGPDWREFNEHRCLMITLDRPRTPQDVPSHLMHIAIAALLAGKGNALVGYKNRLGIINDHPEEDVWNEYRRGTWHRTVPKRLAEPFQRYLAVIDQLHSQ